MINKVFTESGNVEKRSLTSLGMLTYSYGSLNG